MNGFARVVLISVALLFAVTGRAVAEEADVPIAVAQAQNPCAARNPCVPLNPCAAVSKVDPKLITRPKKTKLLAGKRAELVKLGKELWNSSELSAKKDLACQTCHQGNAGFMATFAKPYPHKVAMATQRAGLKGIQVDEMVQLCLIAPMASKPLPWESRELAALTAYVQEVQKTFKPAKPAANPCAMRNPCAANPCSPTR